VLITVVLMTIGLMLGRGLLKGEREAYERGAAVARLYYECRAAFPSTYYLDLAFSKGDPATCAEVERVDAKKSAS
jgi:hypothetical protein